MTQNTQHWSVRRSMTADQATSEDKLGFEPYVRAIRDFLVSEDTQAPLTLSVEGEWGSGKSSFMKQLQSMLEDSCPKPITVWFNPWRHDDEQALWAAFVLQFLDRVRTAVPLWQRPLRNWWLYLWQFNWSQGWMHLVRKVALTLLAIGLIIGAPIHAWLQGFEELSSLLNPENQGLTGAVVMAKLATAIGGGAVYVTMLMTFAIQARKLFESPVEVDLRRFVKSPNYEDRIAFVGQFHRDFGKIVHAYVGNRKTYVFIDDLDRCEVPKAAELMKAINLMISHDDDLPIVFVIGMDREKVAAGLAVQHQRLIPYIKGQGTNRRIGALEYGYEFIEKFIQLPFTAPRPSEQEFHEFVGGLARNPRRDSVRGPFSRLTAVMKVRVLASWGWLQWASRWTVALLGRSIDTTMSVIKRPRRDRRSNGSRVVSQPVVSGLEVEWQVLFTPDDIARLLEDDSETLDEILEVLSPAIGDPARQSRFVDILRRSANRALGRGLFVNGGVTVQRLAKLQAIGVRWPLLLDDLDRQGTLIATLQRIACGEPTRKPMGDEEDQARELAARYWSSRQDLLDLLRRGYCQTSNGDRTLKSAEWSLSEIDAAAIINGLGLKPTQRIEILLADDSETLQQILRVLGPALDYNPRTG